MTVAHRVKSAVARALLPRAELDRLARLRFRDAGHGFDVLGLEPLAVAAALGACRFAYERYFRVESQGIEHVPARGAAILASNHSGLLPIDAAMLIVDVLRRTDPPRIPRAIGDVFIPLMPWIGTLFSRVGVVSGSRANFRHLLENGELVLVFPEGAAGIGKGFARRYQLESWRVGHAELALRHRVPVIPIAVVGAEEAWPQLTRIDRFHAFGAPFLPIPLTPVPLPGRLHVRYGEPLELCRMFDPERADDPRVASQAAECVRAAVADLLRRGLEERRGMFR